MTAPAPAAPAPAAPTALPPALGFLATAGRRGGRVPDGPVATRARRTPFTATLTRQVVAATLLHGQDADPRRARARLDDTAVVLAGEFHNRDELASVLPDAAAHDNDAQLLASLVARYDLHAFRLVNGRFAAVVAIGGRLCAATDHAGSVPLYLRSEPGRLQIATEAKALARAGGPSPAHLAGARRVPGLPGVHQVPAGTVLDVDVATGAATAHRTWAPPHARRIMTEDAAVDAVRTTLRRAVERRLPASVRPLVVLSGGIDSSGVAALAAAGRAIDTVSMGTDLSDEFAQARTVATHLGTRHEEHLLPMRDLLGELPFAVWAAESAHAEIIEYLLPLVSLYRRLQGPPRRILTGYGADIPLAGMHREDRLPALDSAVARDMATFDGLNEMSPVLAATGGHWTSHPYWDRDVLDLLVALEAGLKRRHGRDKWVLRSAMTGLLPDRTVRRPKLGVHEGSGVSAAFTRLLAERGAAGQDIPALKQRVVRELFDRTVAGGEHPGAVSTEDVVRTVLKHHQEGV